MSKIVTQYDSPAPRGTAVFDLDGTLVDSVPDLLASANRQMATLGLAPFTAPDITPMVGDGAGALIRRLLAARGIAATPGHAAAFITDYLAHVAEATRPYPGVSAMLDTLAAAGWRLAVCTNKPAAPTRALLAHLGLLDHFAAIGAGDSYPARKPDPAHLHQTLTDAGGTPAQAVMIGDHPNDLAAASAAGLPSIYVTWGYGQNTGATAVAHTASDIPALAASLVPPPP